MLENPDPQVSGLLKMAEPPVMTGLTVTAVPASTQQYTAEMVSGTP
jgi:hypothetical protein